MAWFVQELTHGSKITISGVSGAVVIECAHLL
jgi:hypothetical protein